MYRSLRKSSGIVERKKRVPNSGARKGRVIIAITCQEEAGLIRARGTQPGLAISVVAITTMRETADHRRFFDLINRLYSSRFH
jgi:hypothetical protein